VEKYNIIRTIIINPRMTNSLKCFVMTMQVKSRYFLCEKSLKIPKGGNFVITLIIHPTKWYFDSITRRMLLVEQELPTLPEHLSSPPVFIGVRVTQSLVICLCFVQWRNII
jgi:hypothetical protein